MGIGTYESFFSTCRSSAARFPWTARLEGGNRSASPLLPLFEIGRDFGLHPQEEV